MGYGTELVGQVVDLYVTVMKDQQPTLQLDPEAVAKTKSLMLYAVPVVWGIVLVLMLLAAYYIAIRIVAASSRNLRPREDIPSALRMNRNAIFVFLASHRRRLFGGIPALIGAAALGAFGAGSHGLRLRSAALPHARQGLAHTRAHPLLPDVADADGARPSHPHSRSFRYAQGDRTDPEQERRYP